MKKQLSHLAAVLAAAAIGGMGAAHAQPVYRIVGPDGKVTFSDRAPNPTAQPATVGTGSSAAGTGALPYALRQVADRYPVVLYTGNDCVPCVGARNLLINRGIPFSERTVNTNEDLGALKRISGGNTLPFGSIGSQQLNGFSDTEWTQYLDAAGYPKQSELPGTYRRPAPAPLVMLKEQSSPAAGSDSSRPAPVATPKTTPSNPAGIIF